MATETVTVRMSRGDEGTPWGFRLQGGHEFGSSLTIGKVRLFPTGLYQTLIFKKFYFITLNLIS